MSTIKKSFVYTSTKVNRSYCIHVIFKLLHRVMRPYKCQFVMYTDLPCILQKKKKNII